MFLGLTVERFALIRHPITDLEEVVAATVADEAVALVMAEDEEVINSSSTAKVPLAAMLEVLPTCTAAQCNMAVAAISPSPDTELLLLRVRQGC